MLALGALEFGNINVNGATGAVLKRSLNALTSLVNHAVAEVKLDDARERTAFSVESFMSDAEAAARLDVRAIDCNFVVRTASHSLFVQGNRELLQAALANLVQNAFKFTHPHSQVTLSAYSVASSILIEVEDHCGGLPPGSAAAMFTPFSQRSADKSGLGLGLAISRDNVEQDPGSLSVRNLPGQDCVFTMTLPLHSSM